MRNFVFGPGKIALQVAQMVRLIADDVAGFSGPGVTHTPITYARVTLAPGAQISTPWNPALSAMAYVLISRGTAGPGGLPGGGRPTRRVRARATTWLWRPLAGTPSRWTSSCWAGCRSASRSPTSRRPARAPELRMTLRHGDAS